MNIDKIIHSIDSFPACPGVYLMKDARDMPLYIGKAVNLKSRVKSYFLDPHHDRPNIPPMLNRLHHVDFIATNTESEAMILEATLVRRKKPPYNVDLKDDKRFPYLKITNEPFPRLLVVRRVYKDGAKYFGPFTDAGSMRRLMHFAKKIFRLRDCNKKLPLNRQVRPCLNYSIGRCSGACAGKISRESYRNTVTMLADFLQGKRKDLLAMLQEQMEKAASRHEYELAAQLRDQIHLIKDASKLQQADLRLPGSDCDIFGSYNTDKHVCLTVLSFREGLLVGKQHFTVQKEVWDFESSSRDSLIVRYYLRTYKTPPTELILSRSIQVDKTMLECWLKNRFHKHVTITLPHKGKKQHLINLAEKNGALYLNIHRPVQAIENVHALQQACRLPMLPRVIEAFDISNLGGSFAVAGMVCFRDGVADKSGYRRYKIKTVDGQNDFAMLIEAVTRRLDRLQRDGKPFPDLLLIDGGKGQLNAARSPLSKFESPPMVIALAKKEEILFSPYTETPVQLPPAGSARKLAEQIRDEVHRYTVAYHRKLRGRQFRRSSLQSIEGIGRHKAQRLLRHFGSVRKVKEASVEEIAEVKGFSPASAKKLMNLLAHQTPEKSHSSHNPR
ncbi:MAG: excinuclease ABC subunit UvrC [Chitinivibrionales bacterium]|nr:excinuclease ABC subunit UvrC [Chitinivibrionales bacterium]